MRDRLIGLIESAENQRMALALCCTVDELIDVPSREEYVADHLIANGVILLPFKIGQTLYDVTEFVSGTYAPEMYELKDNELYIEKGKDGKLTFVYDGMYVYPEEIGKTVFLTKEEAEKALKEKGNG